MSSNTAILVVLNNYVHDVATGLLLISALWLTWSARDLGRDPPPVVLQLFHKTYRRCVRFVIGSVAVIVLTGAVRAVYFMRVEWFPALGRQLTPILVAKHVVIFTALGAGVYAWYGLRRRLRGLPGWRDLADDQPIESPRVPRSTLT